ncbi:hypothetical protein [Propionimicrobium sp. PCR01-08-3]|uniref:hypothetical protein n=1 Tax=Propionimicrobium sp. PCR01-08-3 TaxID=3052086 RepID=UPI00255C699D|nr:hypothetical protein [Propionimicrobium sp. PCR01-08-3]WIY84316.1 hypothetical protein QQ658_15255 [Propionimicrobium sp. PCR01-08-3]
MNYWHGGIRPKDGLLTPQPMARCGEPGDGYVYITTDRDLAATYAATLPGSWVMEVEPVGEVERDPGSILATSFRCRSARVLWSYSISNAEREQRVRSVGRFA